MPPKALRRAPLAASAPGAQPQGLPQAPASAAVSVSGFTNTLFGQAPQENIEDVALVMRDAAPPAGHQQQQAGGTPLLSVGETLASNDPTFAEYLKRARDADKTFVSTRRDLLLEGRGAPADGLGEALASEFAPDASSMDQDLAPTMVARSAVPPAMDVDGRLVLVRWTHSHWPDLVAKDYLRKKRRFGGRVAVTARRAKGLLALLLVALCAIGWYYPVWDVLVDIDAGEHFRTLELSTSATPKEVRGAYKRLTRKWHPDLNPDCGTLCVDKMREVQRAHDVLAQKGDAASRGEMGRKYEDAMAQLLSFVFYRGFGMAFHFATVLGCYVRVPKWLVRRRSARRQLESLLIVATNGLVVLAFTITTVVKVTGPNIVMLLLSGYRIISHFREERTSRQSLAGIFEEEEDESEGGNEDGGEGFARKLDSSLLGGARDLLRAQTLNAFDLTRCLTVFVLPAVLLHLSIELLGLRFTIASGIDRDGAESSLSDTFYHLFFGVCFLCGHLIVVPPNLWDNLNLMQCVVPQGYFSATRDPVTGRTSHQVTLWSFLIMEGSILLDDVFAFVTHIPAPYRLAMYAAHGLFLVELFTLPWATPRAAETVRSVRVNAKLAALSAAKEQQRLSAAAGSNPQHRSSPSTAGGDKSAGATQYASNVQRLMRLSGQSSKSNLQRSMATLGRADGGGNNKSPRAEPPLKPLERDIVRGLDAERAVWNDLVSETHLRWGRAPPRGTRAHEVIEQILKHGKHAHEQGASEPFRSLTHLPLPRGISSFISPSRVAVNMLKATAPVVTVAGLLVALVLYDGSNYTDEQQRDLVRRCVRGVRRVGNPAADSLAPTKNGFDAMAQLTPGAALAPPFLLDEAGPFYLPFDCVAGARGEETTTQMAAMAGVSYAVFAAEGVDLLTKHVATVDANRPGNGGDSGARQHRAKQQGQGNSERRRKADNNNNNKKKQRR